MGNQKQKWTAEEEEALKAGVAKHGHGKWKNILVDAEFAPKLSNRSNVDLKDKWRNMGAGHGQGCRDNSTAPKNPTAPSTSAPKTENDASASTSKDQANDNPPLSPQDVKNATKYNAMILEALSSLKDPEGSDIGAIVQFIEQKYEVPQNFRRLLSSKLRRLVAQGKLEKVLQCYKIKDDAEVGTKTPSPKQDTRPRLPPPLEQPNVSFSCETLEDAATAAAQWVAEAENKAYVTAEAIKESERVAQMAEDAHSMLLLATELFEQCSRHGYVILT